MNFEKKNNIYKTIMIIAVTALTTFLITMIGSYNYYIKADTGIINSLTSQNESNSNTITTLDKEITIVKAYLKQYYLGNIDESKCIESAVKGYVDGLGDQYTEYLTEEEYNELMIDVNGDYVGIGIYMAQDRNENVIILAPIENSPAEEARIKIRGYYLKSKWRRMQRSRLKYSCK